MTRLMLWDVDGTLLLTGGAGQRAMTRAFADLFGVGEAFKGIPMAGRTDRAIVEEALARWGVVANREVIERFRLRYHERLREEIDRPGPRKGVMPGVRELLDLLVELDGLVLALLTGNFAEAARIKLEYFGLWRYFRWGVFGDEVTDRRDLLPLAIAHATHQGMPTLTPHEIVVLGDTPHDVACARAVGARAVAVATGDFDAAALRAAGADVVLNDLRDRAAFLRVLERS